MKYWYMREYKQNDKRLQITVTYIYLLFMIVLSRLYFFALGFIFKKMYYRIGRCNNSGNIENSFQTYYSMYIYIYISLPMY